MILWIILVHYSFSLVSVRGADMEIGNTIDLLKNYGLLMRIYPSDVNHNDFEQDEFSHNIFDKSMMKKILTIPSPTEGTWKVKVCDNIFQVLDELFSGYKIEYVENIRNSFSTVWPLKVLAEFLGLHLTTVFRSTSYTFMLVQHTRCTNHFQLSDRPARASPVLDIKFLEAVDRIIVGDVQSSLNFISQLGSHYINSYSTSGVIYQVFAIPSIHSHCFSMQSYHSEDFNFNYVHQKCMNGSQVRFGRIKTLSDLKSLEERLNRQRYNSATKKYEVANIFNLKNEKIVELCDAENLVATRFSLNSICDMIRDRQRSTFLREVIDNQMKLRELSL